MDQPLTDRRHDTRFLSPLLRLTRATLRPGHVVSLIDLSAGGALIQCPRPMRPGSRVYLQVATDARTVAMHAHVLRCTVVAVNPHEGLTYRGAVKFEHRCDLFWEGGTLAGSSVPGPNRSLPPDPGKPVPGGTTRSHDVSRRLAK